MIGDSGEPLGGAASQRRTLALLAMLATAGKLGMSRDKLAALLWPEADTERARHSLTQAFYSAKRALSCEGLFVESADVRLNSGEISSDVSDLEEALEAGKLETAVALYRGPFLDGFFLAGAPEFERWNSAQRERLATRVIDAFQRLAARASAAGEAPKALESWRRAADLRPLDSGIAVHLMESMAAAGDRAGALQHARVHEVLLREQLDLAPDPAVVELTRRVREPAADSPPALEPPRPPDPVSDLIPQSGASPVGQGTESTDLVPALARVADVDSLGVWVPDRRRSLRRRLILVATAVIVVIAGGIGVRAWNSKPAVRRLSRSQQVVVAPFRVASASPSLAYLREGLVELLATRLADDSAAQSVDAGAVLGAWRAAGLTAAVDIPRDTVVAIAARLGAKRLVIGSVIGTPSRLIVRATVLGLPDGEVRGEAVIEGPADSLTALVDRLAARLLVAQAGEDESLASHTTSSLSALRAFLGGQSAFRRSDYSTAVRSYESALRADSSFALAALRLAVAAERLNDFGLAARGSALAWRSRQALGERDLAMLTTFVGPRFPALSPVRAQLAAWQHVVELGPLSPEAWYTLGSRLFHEGELLQVPAAADRARSALDRALSLDTNYAPAARLLMQLGARPGSGARADSVAFAAALQDSLTPFAPFLRWRMAVAAGDTIARAAERAGFDGLGPANLRAIAMTAQFDVVALRDAEKSIEILRARPAANTIRVAWLLAAHSLALNEGHLRDAVSATERLRVLQPGARAYLRLGILDALYGDADSVVARDAARRLDDLTGAGLAATGGTSVAWLADRCALAQWRLHNSDTVGVAQTVRELSSRPSPIDLPQIAATPAACAELLDGWLAVVSTAPSAAARVARLDSLAFTAHSAGDAIEYAPLLIARLHERVGDPRGALRAIRRRAYLSGWPRYLATMLRTEGDIAAQLADTSGARSAYQRYLAFRHDPDPSLAAQSATVTDALQRLTPR